MFIKVFKKHRNQFLKFFSKNPLTSVLKTFMVRGFQSKFLELLGCCFRGRSFTHKRELLSESKIVLEYMLGVAFSIVLVDFVGGDD